MRNATQIKIRNAFLVLLLTNALQPSVALPQDKALATAKENILGVSVSRYEYDEPGVMTVKAPKVGFDYSVTHVFPTLWPQVNTRRFVRGEFRYATAIGQADYSSPISGTLNNTNNWYVEARALFGSDLDMGSYVLAPYIGLGLRYLHHDLRGTTSAGQLGYRRDTSYTSASVGLTHKTRLNALSQLHSTVEYVHLLQGRHEAMFSDSGGVDVKIDQKRGYGLRLSSLWRFDTWSIGPAVTYWDIDRACAVNSLGATVCEPKNTTTEIGLKLGYHF